MWDLLTAEGSGQYVRELQPWSLSSVELPDIRDLTVKANRTSKEHLELI